LQNSQKLAKTCKKSEKLAKTSNRNLPNFSFEAKLLNIAGADTA
jgi:hypothetical protein